MGRMNTSQVVDDESRIASVGERHKGRGPRSLVAESRPWYHRSVHSRLGDEMLAIRRIKTALFALTALGACTGGGGHPTAAGVCEDSCAQAAECDEEWFQSEYASYDECENECEDEIGAVTEAYPDCHAVYLRFQDCVASLSCEELDSDGGDCYELEYDFESCAEENFVPNEENVEACEDFEDTINGLPCYADYGVDLACDDYAAASCDYSAYFDCTALCYGCDGEAPTFDNETFDAECAPLADCG